MPQYVWGPPSRHAVEACKSLKPSRPTREPAVVSCGDAGGVSIVCLGGEEMEELLMDPNGNGPLRYLENGCLDVLHVDPSHRNRKWSDLSSTERTSRLFRIARMNRQARMLRGGCDDFWETGKTLWGFHAVVGSEHRPGDTSGLPRSKYMNTVGVSPAPADALNAKDVPGDSATKTAGPTNAERYGALFDFDEIEQAPAQTAPLQAAASAPRFKLIKAHWRDNSNSKLRD
eukprot:gnl/TRDRNA2_/TRDRNA2_129697_c0_seq2.p1 gnl/TRDRNA2_/TRDRNA2_129697_c0~~gnl/TRDRNA2_/TRDRNA2_129697_c0_seq2.p1  ORF type:complete len:230 (+),score=23.17 gnl/TRDRNA2_/TRDRNA2_129697_c0_seq2:212-901(+)